MRLYESVIIFDPQLKAPEIEENVKKFTNFVANHGGEIVKQEEWGKRRLAYEINRKQYGYYVLLRIQGQGQLVALLEREYKLNEMVLRYLTIQVEKKALKMEQQLAEKSESDAEPAVASTASKPEKPEAKPESEAEPEQTEQATEEQAGTEEEAETEAVADDTSEEEAADDDKKKSE